MLFASTSVRDGRAPRTQNITSHLPYLFPPQPLTVECLRGRPAGSVCVNTSTYREPSAFEQNTGYATRGLGRGRGCRRAGASAGTQARVQACLEAVRKHQAEVAAPK